MEAHGRMVAALQKASTMFLDQGDPTGARPDFDLGQWCCIISEVLGRHSKKYD